MRLWHVHLVAQREPQGGGRVDAEALDAFMDALAALGADGPVVAGGDGRYAATLTLEADREGLGVLQAAHELFSRAARQVGLPAFPLVRLEIVTDQEREAELSRSPLPALVGVAETAAILGVSRQRVSALAAGNTRFPRPVMRLAAGPVWLRPAIEQFERQWDRRAGRPAAVKA